MMYISKRSLKASKNGVQLASLAILRFPTKIDFAAELEISRSTVQNFFAGKAVGRENFHKICQELNLSWEEVAELPQDSSLKPIEIDPEVSLKQESITEQALENVETESAVDLVAEYRLQVRSRILSMCGTMRVLDMSHPLDLEDIYVHTKVGEKIKGRRRIEVNGTIASANKKTRTHCFDLEEVLTQVSKCGLSAATHFSKLMVLGKPGSGKTMFLKHLTLLCLEEKFESKRIPIFVPLRDFVAYDPSLSLLNYIIRQLTKNCQPPEESQIKQLLNQGKFFIVMDGLDEVHTSDFIAICQHLRRFTEWFPHNRYLISCRHGVQYCNFEQFTEIEIADFEPKQIADFAFKWFDLRGNSKSIGFLQKLNQRNLIQEFAINPLLLTLLCILYDESADFPSSRSEIYEEALDIMFKQWDAERSIERETNGGLSWQQEKELLCYIALRTFEDKQYLFKEAKLKYYIVNYIINLSDANLAKVDAKKVLKSLEAKYGLLVEQAKKVYSSSCLTFQEYLTAKKFVFESDSAVSTAMLNRLVKNITEERWREIFLLVAEMSSQADTLLQMMIQEIDTQIVQASGLNIFLEWVNSKAQAVAAQTLLENQSERYDDQAQIQLETIRAFYFDLGASQILGHLGSNFNFTLSLDPNFNSKLSSNRTVALDLSLFHLTNVAHNLRLVQLPALTFQNIINRAIAHATEIQPELSSKLVELARQLPSPNENTALFWHWWHKQGKAWSDSVNSLSAQYRNMGYRWQFDPQQKQFFEQYCRANVLLLDCLNCNTSVDLEVRKAIKNQLFVSTGAKQGEAQMQLTLRQAIA